MDLPKTVAKLRLAYHSNMLDVNNVLNQLGLLSDEKAEENNKNHVMTIINDIFPRIFGEEAVKKLYEERTKSSE